MPFLTVVSPKTPVSGGDRKSNQTFDLNRLRNASTIEPVTPKWGKAVPLSDFDRELLDRCLKNAPQAWEDFVDRFAGLVVQVVDHAARSRQVSCTEADKEDIVAEIFCRLIENDWELIREFRREASLATYLTVISRRIAVRSLTKEARLRRNVSSGNGNLDSVAVSEPAEQSAFISFLQDPENVMQLMEKLDKKEGEIVRLFYLHGLTYSQISQRLSIPTNSIGPTLQRARRKMRDLIESAVVDDS